VRSFVVGWAVAFYVGPLRLSSTRGIIRTYPLSILRNIPPSLLRITKCGHFIFTMLSRIHDTGRYGCRTITKISDFVLAASRCGCCPSFDTGCPMKTNSRKIRTSLEHGRTFHTRHIESTATTITITITINVVCVTIVR